MLVDRLVCLPYYVGIILQVKGVHITSDMINLSVQFIRRKSIQFIRRNDFVVICCLQVKTVETVDLPDSVVEIVGLQVKIIDLVYENHYHNQLFLYY